MRSFVLSLPQMTGQQVFFLFDIGLFQGCVLSTILFDCVFQLLLDFLRPQKALGYCFKSTPSVSTHKKAYADDLTLLTRNTINMQSSVNQTSIWLKWSQTMRAKPSKSISVGFKMFEKKMRSSPLFWIRSILLLILISLLMVKR
jgi:hypothetical protein